MIVPAPERTIESSGFEAFASRQHMEDAVLVLCRPVIQRARRIAAGVNLDPADAAFSGRCQGMERLCRLWWGLAPIVADGRVSTEGDVVRIGSVAGTDERHPGFWGWPEVNRPGNPGGSGL
jgi:hypothetical protein